MKIGFYLNNTGHDLIDFSHPENGNPGIRGTEYMIWEIACGLGVEFAEVYLFAPYPASMPATVTAVKCGDELDALEKAKRLDVDIMVLRSLENQKEVFRAIDRCGVKCVMWSHNLETVALADAMADCRYVRRNVCVSRQQYERLRDHPVFEKSTYIYNALVFSSIPREVPRAVDKKNVVTYIGTLEAYKGFHALAHVWPEIKKKVPDAVLYVLDSEDRGRLIAAGDDARLTEYEKDIRRSLSDERGELLPGVTFEGCQRGSVKEATIMKTKVGVANPGGVEEFCVTAVEFEAYGVPVVAKRSFGLLETVCDRKTGILIKNERQLADAVVRLLCDDGLCDVMGTQGSQYVREHFDMPLIIEDWKKVLTEVYEDLPVKPDYRCTYPFFNYKWLRELSRLWKKTPFGRNSPSVMKYEK